MMASQVEYRLALFVQRAMELVRSKRVTASMTPPEVKTSISGGYEIRQLKIRPDYSRRLFDCALEGSPKGRMDRVRVACVQTAPHLSQIMLEFV
jgi:hypothetical protein